MGKLNAIRANVGWTNVSSVSNYYSDIGNFQGYKSSFVSTTETNSRTSVVTRETTVGEDANGFITRQKTQVSNATSYTYGNTSFTSQQSGESNFLSSTLSYSGSNFSSLTNGNDTHTRSFSVEQESNRFNHSSTRSSTLIESSGASSSFTATAQGNGGTVQVGNQYTRSGSSSGSSSTYLSSSFNQTTLATTRKGEFQSGFSGSTTYTRFNTDGSRETALSTTTFGNSGETDTFFSTLNTRESSAIRSSVSSTGTSTTYSYSASSPDTFLSTLTSILTNESNFDSTFSYTFKSTTWSTSTTYQATSFQPSNLTTSYYTTDETQQIVSSFYQAGNVYGYVPLDSLDVGVTFDFDVSNLTSSISHWDGYLPNRNIHSQEIIVESDANDQLTWYQYSQIFGPGGDSTTITRFTYTTQTLTNIVESATPIFGNFSFGKTSSISTNYVTQTDAYLDFTNLSTSTYTSFINTIITSSLSDVKTASAQDIGDFTTGIDTTYRYSSEISSSTKEDFFRTTSRQIGFFDAGNSATYTSTFFAIERSAYPFFRVVAEGYFFTKSLISKLWGGLNGFQIETSKKITGIPTIDFTDQYITTGSRVVTDVSTVDTVVNTTTSFGPTTTFTQDSFQTTTTFTSGVTGNKIEETEYELPLYDTSYKLNRYYTYIPTSGSFNYVAGESSFFSTNNQFSVTNTRSQIFKTSTALTDNTFSYSSLLFGLRKEKAFGDVTTREIPGFLNLSSIPTGGEDFIDTEGTLLITADAIDRDFDPSIFTGTSSGDYITFDFSASSVISSTMPKHQILRLKNTHGAIKLQDGYEYFGEFYGPVGERYYVGGFNQFPAISGFR